MAVDLSSWTIAGLVLGFLVLLPTIMGLFSSNKFNVSGKTVLLTGASEGMGKNVAIQLAQKGANIIIVARNVGKLEEALSQIKADLPTPHHHDSADNKRIQASAANPSTQRFQHISADVSEPSGAARVIAEAIAWNNGESPDIVWCIAGTAYPNLFLETPVATMRHQMDVNFWSCVDMAHAILNDWLTPSALQQGKERHLVFTSSVVAFYPVAGYGPYAPSKAAIKSLSDTLAQEVLLYGDSVKIHTVFPGTILSPGLTVENQSKPDVTHILEEADPQQTPEVVAAWSIAGLERGQYLVTVSWLGSLMRACAWGGSTRNNWLFDTLETWLASIVWMFAARDTDGKVVSYRKKHGHPSTYAKKV
ncbi:3-ketodihydrosphingosine reductase gsl-3 [Lachnellula arida]|uniref:3-dehydrosphinganine reductase n=1 Tax=Lachnellula arida TaxID=1316785 RepID=A0A8T9BCS5_9HELO|nr:3-ketodihydrosphingosine reductase gsl-3 [Lachnellula arida]